MGEQDEIVPERGETIGQSRHLHVGILTLKTLNCISFLKLESI